MKRIYKKNSLNNKLKYIMKRIYKKIFAICFLVIVTIFLNRTCTFNQTNHYKYGQNPIPKILWWTTMPKGYNKIETCGIYKCHFTGNRSIINNSETKAILFYGSNIISSDFPLPRLSHHIWGLYHEESPKNIAYLRHEKVLKYFNYTATFSRYSDFPLTTVYLKSYELLRSRKYLIPIGEKSKLRKKLAPVVFLQSICDTLSGREDYIGELMTYIPIDSYGNCLNNKNLTESLRGVNYLATIESDELFSFLAQYKFIIAYENAICNDYITEKFWRPIIIGSIPIYFGSPTIKDWLPNEKSAILISDFKSPKNLADFIKYLDENDAEYNKYLDHKYSQISPVSNSFLKNILTNNVIENENVFEGFECFVCKKIHNLKNNQSVHATGDHYNCGDDIVFPKIPGKLVTADYNLYGSYEGGKCEAESLDRFFTKNVNYTSKDFEKEVINNVNKKKCKAKFF